MECQRSTSGLAGIWLPKDLSRTRPLMAPLCVKGVAFPPVDGAPVLAAVKQTALDCGCGSALGQGEEGAGPAEAGGVACKLAGPGSGCSEVPALGCEPVALESVAVPRCPPGPVTVCVIASLSMRR